jgi:hypothetical protein
VDLAMEKQDFSLPVSHENERTRRVLSAQPLLGQLHQIPIHLHKVARSKGLGRNILARALAAVLLKRAVRTDPTDHPQYHRNLRNLPPPSRTNLRQVYPKRKRTQKRPTAPFLISISPVDSNHIPLLPVC